MQTQMKYKARLALPCLLVATLALLAGCGNKQDEAAASAPSAGAPAPAGGSPSLAGGTPAKVQQSVQQQAAQRAAYFNSHPAGKGTGQGH